MENKRQLLHISMVVFCFLLRWLNWWQAALCALAALLHNVFVLPHTGKAFFREKEKETGIATGILIYPVTVLILIVLFRGQLYLAAAGWGILSFGDGFATIVGKAIGKKKLPWNKDKSWAGSIAYVISGTIGATFFMWWSSVNPTTPLTISVTAMATICFVGSLVAGLVETFDLPVDDNLTAPLAGALAIWCVFIVFFAPTV